jgi:hypothetical protein
MSPVLIDSIRQRMREQTTEQLLDMWVANDRVTWSPEAFEAVKSLLAERGVKELAPQNDPAPMARPHSATDDPTARYWLGWLRPVLWVCVAIGGASLPHAVFQAASLVVAVGQQRIPSYVLWRGRDAVVIWLGNISEQCVLPLMLIVGAVGCLRLKAWGRMVLLTYGFVSVAVGLALVIVRTGSTRYDGWISVGLMTVPLAGMARIVGLPAILWILLRRPEIRNAFVPLAIGRAFEPLAAGTTLSKPTPA